MHASQNYDEYEMAWNAVLAFSIYLCPVLSI